VQSQQRRKIMLTKKYFISALAVSFIVSLASVALASGLGSGELDGSYEVVKSMTSSPAPSDSFAAGLASGELDRSYDAVSPSGDSSRNYVASSSGLGSGELDARGTVADKRSASWDIFAASGSASVTAVDFSSDGLGSGELDEGVPADSASNVAPNDSGDNSTPLICATTLGINAEAGAADYCNAIHGS
jgi:hypothetical protein